MSTSFFGETGPMDVPKPYLSTETIPVIIFEAIPLMPSPIGVIPVTAATSAEITGE